MQATCPIQLCFLQMKYLIKMNVARFFFFFWKDIYLRFFFF